MKKFYFFVSALLLFTSSNLSAQSQNMNSLYNHNIDNQTYNDCWGYVDGNGNEYAIVGTRTRILFYNVTDPNNVILVQEFVNGTQGIDLDYTIWRDFKTYGTKAYACADQGSSNEGLIVFDLSGLPNSVTFVENNRTFFNKAHNIYIDESTGYLYTAGANTEWNGTIILDLNTNPITEVASEVLYGGYIHDLHVKNGIGYCNSEYSGLVVIDFTDPENPATLGTLGDYPGEGYNHSCWLTESGTHLVFCDETTGTKVKIADVTNLNNITITNQFNSNSPLSTSIAHNPFVKDDFVYVAYYHDGVYVFDISDPYNVFIHGYYDTDPNNTDGVWGVYPYLPSGNIIATDMDNGFFMLEVLNLPLPVELTHFSARAETKKVSLEWATASEKNSKLFEVQKSADGVDFKTIESITAAGNSEKVVDYSTFDENPFLGDNYYRLKQVDLDGKFEYSDVKVVRFSTSPVEVFPTLVTNGEPLKILFSKNVQDLQIHIISIQGQLLQKTMLSGENGQQQELYLNNLPNGSYLVEAVSGNKQMVTKRIVIAR